MSHRVTSRDTLTPPPYRKLLVIDYFGCVLTLGGCALVLLPLIWVRTLLPAVEYFGLIGVQGRYYFPLALTFCPGAAVVLFFLCCSACENGKAQSCPSCKQENSFTTRQLHSPDYWQCTSSSISPLARSTLQCLSSARYSTVFSVIMFSMCCSAT